MASTAHKTEEEKKEYFDTPEELEKKITILAKIIKESNHFIAFTGAGISTSTGIPDFRSGANTVLETGPGAWEKQAVKIKVKKQSKSVPMLKAIPSPTHMALVELEKKGILKFLISQNVDGLHRRSGFNPEKMAELHGNTNLEVCQKCGKKFLRDFRVRNAQKVHSHETGRICSIPGCKGKLLDSIINFGESLPEKDMQDGFSNSKKADVCLSLGSSLRVTPAADMPSLVAERHNKLVIVNLQKTPLDSMAYLCIHAMCDTVMQKLSEKLELNIPKFTLTRRIKVQRQGKEIDQEFLIQGIDSDDLPYSLFKSIELIINGKKMLGTKEPFLFKVKEKIQGGKISFNLKFQQNYQEPDLKIDVILAALKEKKGVIYIIEYDPKIGKWINVIEKL